MAGLSQFTTGDFNGDNKADFTIVTQVGTGTAPAPAFIFLGDGQGHFSDQTAAVFANGSAMNAVGGGRTLVADFNNDGRSDLFQLNFGGDAPPFPGGQNSLYLSSPSAGTLADVSATLPRTLELNHGGSTGDLNGDGFADVLLNTLDEGSLLLMNDGTGHFNSARPGKLPRPLGHTSYGDYPESHTFSGIVDVNGDRRPDLILGTWDGTMGKHESKVLLNDGTGDFSRQASIALPASGIDKEIVLDVEPIDLNGDGFADLMLSITNGGTNDVFYRTAYIQLLVNDGTGHFRDETVIRLPQDKTPDAGGWLMSLTPVDFNRDGAMDILAESAGGTVRSSVYLNDGKGHFTQHWQSGPGERTAAIDLQGDGMADLLSAAGNLRMIPLSNYLPNDHVYRANFGGEELLGSAGNDTFVPRDGRNVFDGAGGMDIVRFSGARADYSVTGSAASGVTITGAAGNVAMTHIERAVFGDAAVAFDVDGAAGQTYRLYQAAFDRKPDAAGFGFWLTQMEKGASLQAVAGALASSPEFISLVGATASGEQFVTAMYANVLHRLPDKDGMAFWLSILDRGVARGDVLASFGESPENQAQVIGTIQAGMEYVPYS
nr:FG-GAP-like repeat-containing protein [Massilia polaris]